MKKIRFKSLTMQIWVYFIAMITAIAIAFFSINYFMVYKFEKEKNYKNLELFQDMIINSENKYDKDEMIKELSRYNYFHDLDYFFVLKNGNGVRTLVANDDQKYKLPDFKKKQMEDLVQDITRYVCENNKFNITREKNSTDQGNLFVVKKISNYDNKKDMGLFIIAFSKRPFNKNDLSQLIYFSAVIIIIALFVSKLISNSISKPLKKLEEYTKKIAKKEWAEPLKEERQDEIGRLVTSMNIMQSSLKKAEEEEQVFLQSISHDLKTPVMVIKSYAESIIDGIYIDDLFNTATIIGDEATKLEIKIKKMIYFNSLDFIMENEKNISDVSLDGLFKVLYERLKLIRQDINWQLDLEETKLYCNGENLSVAFENIIENQLRYAKEIISIKLFTRDDKMVIEIYNDGNKIDEKNINFIFDKFYKGKKGNFGLGLAITKKIITHYHGSIKAVNEEKGVKFIITFDK